MRIPNDISNEDLFKLILDNIYWINVWEERFSRTTYTQFLASGYVSPKQRGVLFKIAARSSDKSMSIKNSEAYKTAHFQKLSGLKSDISTNKIHKALSENIVAESPKGGIDESIKTLGLKSLIELAIKRAHEVKKPNRTFKYLYSLAAQMDAGKLHTFNGARESLYKILEECEVEAKK